VFYPQRGLVDPVRLCQVAQTEIELGDLSDRLDSFENDAYRFVGADNIDNVTESSFHVERNAGTSSSQSAKFKVWFGPCMMANFYFFSPGAGGVPQG
jgi:hypothetical protein